MKRVYILLLSALLLTGCSVKNVLIDKDNNTIPVEAIIAEPNTDLSGFIDIEPNLNVQAGGYELCPFHSLSYHSVDQAFFNYVGVDVFNEWVKMVSTEKSDASFCTREFTFPNFLLYFNITKEQFCDIYYNNSCYYTEIHDPEILHSGDNEKIEAFYKNIDLYNTEITWREAEHEFKLDIRNLITTEVSEKVNSDLLNVRRLSIAELINRSGASKEEVIKILANENELHKSNLNYDFDKVYNEKEAMLNMDAIAADDLIRISN